MEGPAIEPPIPSDRAERVRVASARWEGALRVVIESEPEGGSHLPLSTMRRKATRLLPKLTALTHGAGRDARRAQGRAWLTFGADGRMKLFNPAFAEAVAIRIPRILRDPSACG